MDFKKLDSGVKTCLLRGSLVCNCSYSKVWFSCVVINAVAFGVAL